MTLPNPPAATATGRNNRTQSITKLAFANGRVWVAGLSNEEFASKLWSVAYPFTKADNGTSVEIYHGNHQQLETALAGVRVHSVHDRQPAVHHRRVSLHAAREVPGVRRSTPGAKFRGTTIAELGAGNRPIDMVLYKKNGKEFLLMSNTSRGVMKIPTAGLRDGRADHRAGHGGNRRRAVREDHGDDRHPAARSARCDAFGGHRDGGGRSEPDGR